VFEVATLFISYALFFTFMVVFGFAQYPFEGTIDSFSWSDYRGFMSMFGSQAIFWAQVALGVGLIMMPRLVSKAWVLFASASSADGRERLPTPEDEKMRREIALRMTTSGRFPDLDGPAGAAGDAHAMMMMPDENQMRRFRQSVSEPSDASPVRTSIYGRGFAFSSNDETNRIMWEQHLGSTKSSIKSSLSSSLPSTGMAASSEAIGRVAQGVQRGVERGVEVVIDGVQRVKSRLPD